MRVSSSPASSWELSKLASCLASPSLSLNCKSLPPASIVLIPDNPSYRRHELATRVGFYAAVSPLAGAFGGILATGLSKVPQFGMIHTWRSIFFFEGLLSIILGVISYIMLPDSPGTASMLTDDERKFAKWRIAEETMSHVPEKVRYP